MSELISRQAAMDLLGKQIEQCDRSLSSFDISMKDEYAVKVERASLVAFRETLEYMPPAQPHTYRGVTLNDVMMYFDSLEGNEDAWTEFCSCLECRGWGLYHIQSATDKNVGTNDTISRQEAIDALRTCYDTETVTMDNGDEYINYGDAVGEIEQLPPAQPEQHIDEWCYSCKEYDKEKHSCPRWNKVIKNTVDELKSAQPEPCEDAVSRTEILRMINCINDHHAITPYKSVGAVTEHLTRIASSLPHVTPKQRTGKWIKKHRHYGGFRSYTGFDAMGEQHTVTVDERTEYDDLYCSECGARSADNFLNFCPHCGAKMEGDAE